ncbi:MAG: deoxyribodipyrimidine photo-lyase [Porticoccaceae bacterium]|jgi:deoxyribodipyrimidine photo-lyase|nr:deoxyribodipyrimidine photo-lyase [Porticoccaceae bacterium]MEA3300724.1 deoxyribodipyrimidine photo-lyase [Pseudomonadota bacterium]HLS98661.1 deoxyribodipyrimidine photo-lyase [Porticoccaceae bacterium]
MAGEPRLDLVWFRNDLRVRDNPALWHGAQHGPVAAVFVLCPDQWRTHPMAPCRADFLLRSLRALEGELARLNIPLWVIGGDTFAAVPDALASLCRRLGARAIHWNDEYPLDEARRDGAVAARLGASGIACHRYHDRALAPPGTVVKADGGGYQVFTPFKRAWLNLLDQGAPDLLPAPRRQSPGCMAWTGRGDIPGALPGFASALPATLWPAGEREARRRLDQFCRDGLAHYQRQRDLPALEGTSALSPYLAVGAISPQECLRAALQVKAGDGAAADGADTWISELVWRDFYQHIVAAHPRVCMGKPFLPGTDRVPWRDDPVQFEAWCQGRTGVPLVDAGMRQLRETGWMHNRVRMVTAMFLAKNLLIDWRLGERFFMEHLVDGDFPANNGGWQWSASTGTDAAPYFRIFNSFSQAERFDPEGAYIQRFVPELRGLPARVLHKPALLARHRPATYPAPVVDVSLSRQLAIDAFRAASA